MTDLSGKTVLITGASKGIGAAAARVFVDAGANVALVARSGGAIETLASEIGPKARAYPCDVSDYDALAAAISDTIKTFGSLDIVVNNAGVIEPITRLSDADPSAWSKAIDINLKGVFNGIHASLPQMQAQGHGTIITVSSGAAHGPMEGWAHYCTAKAGAAMLTKCLHEEMAGHGIRAFGLSPGTVATEMQVLIKASGINKVSELDPSVHVPAEWPAKALAWMCTAAADDLVGTEIALRDPNIRAQLDLG